MSWENIQRIWLWYVTKLTFANQPLLMQQSSPFSAEWQNNRPCGFLMCTTCVCAQSAIYHLGWNSIQMMMLTQSVPIKSKTYERRPTHCQVQILFFLFTGSRSNRIISAGKSSVPPWWPPSLGAEQSPTTFNLEGRRLNWRLYPSESVDRSRGSGLKSFHCLRCFGGEVTGGRMWLTLSLAYPGRDSFSVYSWVALLLEVFNTRTTSKGITDIVQAHWSQTWSWYRRHGRGRSS